MGQLRRVFVYYAQRDGYIKIGSSSDVPNRMRRLRAELLAVEDGRFGEVPERATQRRFAHLRAEDTGLPCPSEWFHPGEDLMAHIADVASRASTLPTPDPPPVPHGTLSGYAGRCCRCDLCCEAGRAYARRKYHESKGALKNALAAHDTVCNDA